MTLGELLKSTDLENAAKLLGMPLDESVLGQTVSDVAIDSRKVNAGSVFAAIKGQQVNGLQFAHQAQARGAIAIISESMPPEGINVPWLVIKDARGALAKLAASFYCHPSKELLMVGVTGTNGKTTTTYIISEIFKKSGVRCGRLSSVSYQIDTEEYVAERTTPEAPYVQRLLRQMVDRGCSACVMEVSSHALALSRVNEVKFSAAVFTNLSRDHLDFHGDMETYFFEKRKLFEMLPPKSVAIINLDDPRGPSLVEMSEQCVTYAIDRVADVVPERFDFSSKGISMRVRTPRGLLDLKSSLLGRVNVYNILAASSVCTALGLPFSAIEEGVADLKSVPGRLQIISTKCDDVTVIVDYAHTDGALRTLLETANQLAQGKVTTVFGCGGNRDRSKRPLMGAVAERLSDLVVLTSDNPRSEKAEDIIDEVKLGLESSRKSVDGSSDRLEIRTTSCVEIFDRRAAIEWAIHQASKGDTVIIAGKGHEKYQEIGDRRLPFDDVEVVRNTLANRRANLGVS